MKDSPAKDWLALRPLVALLALLAVALAAAGAASAAGKADFILPAPEDVADQFVGAMGARRYSGAREQLSQDLQQQVGEDDLRALIEQIEQSPQQGIADSWQVSSQEAGDRASATVRVKLGSGEQQMVEFPLKREQGLWKLDSIEPLARLTGG